MMMYSALLLLCAGFAWFDFRTRRIPNAATLLLLATGLGLHFPGAPPTWMGSALLISGWRLGMLGGGDAKLWLALLWLAPPVLGSRPVLWMGGIFLAGAAFQLIVRWIGGRQLTGFREPAAWRTVPFALWLFLSR